MNITDWLGNTVFHVGNICKPHGNTIIYPHNGIADLVDILKLPDGTQGIDTAAFDQFAGRYLDILLPQPV